MKYPERLSLARLPTPIHLLPRLSKELGCEIYAWRDDLTGFAEAGNKVRKLEFLVADALHHGATTLVTCGGPQSNHARATAVVARRLGLAISILVREPKKGWDPSQAIQANYLIDRLMGADIERIPYSDYTARGSRYDDFLAEKAERLKRKGEVPYIIGEGGSTALGCWGYLAAAEEMLFTWRNTVHVDLFPDAIIAALGSGGTYAGLHLGLEAQELPSHLLHAVNVCDNAPYFEKRVSALFDDMERSYGVRAKTRTMQIMDGHVGLGYAEATDDELRFYAEVARKEGILLDPCYTGKAFFAFVKELKKSPGRFGERVLFLHSGGGFGTFAYGAQYDRVLG